MPILNGIFTILGSRWRKACGAKVLIAYWFVPGGSKRLEDEGFRVKSLSLNGGAMVLFSNLGIIWKTILLFKREKLDLSHHFTIKCVMAGGIAARLLKIPDISAIT